MSFKHFYKLVSFTATLLLLQNLISFASEESDVLSFALATPCYQIAKDNTNLESDLKYRATVMVYEGSGCKSFIDLMPTISEWKIGSTGDGFRPLESTEFYMGVNENGEIDWKNVSFAGAKTRGGSKSSYNTVGRSKVRCEVKSMSKS